MKTAHLIGYLAFALSGVVFVVIGIRERDALTLLAAALWLVGCAAFLKDWRN